MKLSSFTLGAVAAISSLALAVPFAAQIAGAQTTSSSSSLKESRPVPSQACVLALAELEGAHLSSMDAMVAARKAALQAHKDALASAAAITDDAQRAAAVRKAAEDLRAAMQAAKDTQDFQAQIDALRAACGDSGFRGFGPMMGGGMMDFGGRGFGMHGLGKGPGSSRPGKGMMRGWMKFGGAPSNATSNSSAQQ